MTSFMVVQGNRGVLSLQQRRSTSLYRNVVLLEEEMVLSDGAYQGIELREVMETIPQPSGDLTIMILFLLHLH